MEKSSKVNLAIFSAGLITFIGILNETSMNVTYPLLVKEFHQPLATVQWITTAYLLTVTIVMGTTPSLLLLGLALFAIIYALSLIGTSSLISGLVLLPGSCVGAVISPSAGKLGRQAGLQVPADPGRLPLSFGQLPAFGPAALADPGLDRCLPYRDPVRLQLELCQHHL